MRGFGLRTRLTLGAQVLFAVGLAVGGAVLAIDLADWRYVRLDLSASGRNTLDDTILDLIENLPEPVTIDVFFRPLPRPYDGVSLQAQQRMPHSGIVGDEEKTAPPPGGGGTSSSMTPASGMKQEVWSLDEGQAILQWPTNLSPESASDLESWLQLIITKAKRMAGPGLHDKSE